MTDAGAGLAAPNKQVTEEPLDRREVRWAILAEAGLYAIGGALCATALLLPDQLRTLRAP